MKEFLQNLFSSNFMPHGYCYLWKPGLVSLHVVSDALIALAYFSIPLTLVYFIRKRRDLPFHWMFVCFGVFILACGSTHAMEVWTIWHGNYWLSGAIKVVTAMASVPTAILLVQLVPRMLALPSPEALKLEIAERKRAEQALYQMNDELELKVLERTADLKKSEGELRQLIDVIPQQVFVFDSAGSPLFANRQDLEYTGLTPEEAQSEDAAARIFHPEDLKKLEVVRERMRSRDDPFEMSARIRGKDGQYRCFLIRGNPLRDEQGRVVRWYGTRTDIEDRKQAEELFRFATEAAPSGILLANDQGRIVLVNAHIEELFGYRREELIGKLVDILVPERFRSQHPTHRAQFLAAPTARPMGAGRELFARRKDGSEFPVEIGLNPIQTPDGILVLAVIVDITARKFAESEALQHQAQLGHLSRVAVLGEMAASIAHELNQPLSGIISNASAGQRFIDRGDVDLRELRDLLADIVADGRRAGDVIRGVRSMVKKGGPAWQRVNLSDLVMKVVRMLNSDAMLHSCKLETMLEPNLPAVEANPTQLQQVLLNLVVNAFDAMRDTPLSRRKVVIATERNEDGAICTSVRDYGIGIPEEMRERLFEHFFTTKAEGLGLGLGIVRSIVESHGGTVAAENVDGGGARFHFTLPANDTALR